MANWTEWMNAGAKVKTISFGDATSTADYIGENSKSGSSGAWTLTNTITTDDAEIVSMFTSGMDVKCALVSEKCRYGFAAAVGGYYSTRSIETTESGGVVTITLTEHTTFAQTPNYKYLLELTVLFVAE